MSPQDRPWTMRNETFVTGLRKRQSLFYLRGKACFTNVTSQQTLYRTTYISITNQLLHLIHFCPYLNIQIPIFVGWNICMNRFQILPISTKCYIQYNTHLLFEQDTYTNTIHMYVHASIWHASKKRDRTNVELQILNI